MRCLQCHHSLPQGPWRSQLCPRCRAGASAPAVEREAPRLPFWVDNLIAMGAMLVALIAIGALLWSVGA